MSLDKKLTEEQIRERLGNRFASAVITRNLPRSSMSSSELEAFMEARKIFGGLDSSRTDIEDASQSFYVWLEKEIEEDGEIKELRALAMVRNGELVGDAQDLDDLLGREHSYYTDSPEDLLTKTFEGYSLPVIKESLKNMYKPKDKPKDEPDKPDEPRRPSPRKGPRPKHPIKYRIHPKIVENLSQHSHFLTGEAGDISFDEDKNQGREERHRRIITGRNELFRAGLSEKFMADAEKNGFKVYAQSNVDFVRSNIQGLLRKRKGQIMGLYVQLQDSLNAYKISVSGDGDEQSKTRTLLDHCSKSTNVRGASDFFENYMKMKNITEVIVNGKEEPATMGKVFEAFKYDLVVMRKNEEAATEASRMSREEKEEELEEHRQDYEKPISTVGNWIYLVKAAEGIEGNQMIRQAVEMFKDVSSEKLKPAERVYNGMMNLTSRLINPDLHFTADGEVDFILRGLWMKGLFPKEALSSVNPGEEASELEEETGRRNYSEVDREITGVITQYSSPIKHLMKKFNRLDNALWREFERKLDKREIGKDLKLESAADDLKLGFKIGSSIPTADYNRLFTKLNSPNETLVRPRLSGGNISGWILQYYVGCQRGRFLEAGHQHYGIKE